MSTIAAQIDYETDRLAALNEYLKCQAEVRKYEGVDVMKHIEAIVKFTQAKYRLAEFDEPADYVPDTSPVEQDCCATKAEHDQHRRELKAEYAPEQYQRRELMTADERLDDPRRGQGTL